MGRLALAWLLAGCARTPYEPPGPAAPRPPEIAQVFPAPRSAQVDYETEIWAQFDAPLNPESVNPRNVYLKVDTQRLPITVSWDSTLRRLWVHPETGLSLHTTYTVELSAALEAATGESVGRSVLWQFTTMSVRHPVALAPENRGVDSPFAPLRWGGNESTPGTLIYEVHAGADSESVARRRTEPVYRGSRTRYIPTARWPAAGANYWAVTIDNITSGERHDGPVWRFDTPSPNAAVDSVLVVAADWGYRVGAGGCVQGICGGQLWSGPTHATFVTWGLGSLPPSLLLAGIRWDFSCVPGWEDSLAGGVSIWATTSSPACYICGITGNVDLARGALSSGARIGPRSVRFAADTLCGFVQALLRSTDLFGFRITSGKRLQFVSPAGADPAAAPVFRVYFYPAPARARTSAASGTPAAPDPPAPAPAISRRRG